MGRQIPHRPLSIKLAPLLKLNRKTVNRNYQLFREKIYARQQAELENFIGIEVDESYFGRRRARGRPRLKRGRGTLKQPKSFWSFTKRRLAKFNGTKRNFHLLKECEWRWNKTSDSPVTKLKQMMV